jgi:FkbM family methyltransferase
VIGVNQVGSAFMWSAAKAVFRRTPFYPYYFARKTAPVVQHWTDVDDRRLSFYRQFVNPGDLVYDVGANVGHFVKIFLGAGCNLVAIEPQRICAATLRRVFGKKILVLECAISDHRGTATLHGVDGISVISTLETDWIQRVQGSGRFSSLQWRPERRVSLATLDDVIYAHGVPAFLKIDTEGHERSVLRGLSTPVSQLCFEVTPECIEAGIECVDIVASLGRYQFNFSFMDGNALVLDWQAASSMKSFLSRYAKDNRGIGDVYARLHRTP